MLGPLDRLGSPPYLYAFAERTIPWFAGSAALLLVAGLAGGLWLAPEDYQQGDAYRIIFVHVPCAWMSLMIYTLMAAAAACGLVWRIKTMHVFAAASAPIGAAFTLVTLVTGSIWGKPMWGGWWVWDARLTSELILLFLYLGFIALQEAIPDRRLAWRSGAVLLVVGFVNVPIIHYSVEWWNTLHQPASIMKIGAPSIHASMLVPLLLCAFGFVGLYAVVALHRIQAELLERARGSEWAAEIAARAQG